MNGGTKAGEVRFTATDLEDIAKAMDGLAASAAHEKRSEQTKIMQAYRAGEAAAYVTVARMLRATSINQDALRAQNGEMEDLLTDLVNADSSTLAMHKQRAKQYLRSTDRP